MTKHRIGNLNACFYCGQTINLDSQGNFCLVTITQNGRRLTDENGDPWLTALCVECGHKTGAKTIGEMEAIGEATIEPIDPIA